MKELENILKNMPKITVIVAVAVVVEVVNEDVSGIEHKKKQQMIEKYNKFTDKLFESLPRQSTVDQLKRIRDEINKSQDIKVGPEHSTMKGDVGDRVIADLVTHKGKQEMNNLFWWDNPLDRYICSYEDWVSKDSRDGLGYTKDGDPKIHRGTDIPERPESDVPKPFKKMLGKDIVHEKIGLFGRKKKIDPNDPYGEEIDGNIEQEIISNKLKSGLPKLHCPFCGSEDTLEARYDWHMCNDCGYWF